MARFAAMSISTSHHAIESRSAEREAQILLIGFDIWTGEMYRAMRHVSFSGMKFNICALPGHHYNAIYPRLPAALSETRPDIVLLDLASTACREWIDVGNLTAHLHGILKLIGDFGAKVALLNWYDVDPVQDRVLATLNKQAALQNLPVLDVSGWWLDMEAGVLPVDGRAFSISDAVAVALKIGDFVRQSVMVAPKPEGLSYLPVLDHVQHLAAVDAEAPLSSPIVEAVVSVPEPAVIAPVIEVVPEFVPEEHIRIASAVHAKQRVLLIGFSVLTGEIYRSFEKYAADDVEFVLFGLGSHHYNYLPPLLPQILEREKPDIVVFDLASTPCREWATAANIRENVYEMLAMVHGIGARAGFLHLFRHDVKPGTDLLIGTINELAAEAALPVLNVAQWIDDRGGDADHKLLFDGVHATPEGAKAISTMIIDFVRAEMLSMDRQVSLDNVPRSAYLAHVSAVEAPYLSPYGCTGDNFSKYGVKMHVLPIHEGARIPIDLPEGASLSAIYFIHGPRSGDIEISTDHEVIMTHRCYDAWSYYERAMVCHVDVAGARRLWFRQLPGVPDIALIKGKQDHGPRIGKVGHVVMYRP
ncbi:SGNH/GDSL hydrolase family protein [Sphingobium sp. AP49]|uniref:SGNH/GDSL hydrolase family protein n=1 Tax=Sphingobium sp. AP49 TaxID=1144307 RepID=UPI0012F65909|nr:SGNH/GDSL hydrolase family protein [Sphingobium sp. AP49]WHO40631.1 SGNH/GDSL hydrolase family protein [Sphingobium sp. AP49]